MNWSIILFWTHRTKLYQIWSLRFTKVKVTHQFNLQSWRRNQAFLMKSCNQINQNAVEYLILFPFNNRKHNSEGHFQNKSKTKAISWLMHLQTTSATPWQHHSIEEIELCTEIKTNIPILFRIKQVRTRAIGGREE